MRHILVVANQTLAGEQLQELLRSRLEEGPADVFVVVPMTAVHNDLTLQNPLLREAGTPSGAEAASQQTYRMASERLRKGLGLIRTLGCEVSGEVGDENPMDAVDQAFKRQTFDEVVVSTLPTGVSRWLRADLPSRVHRKHHVPVYTAILEGASVR